MRIYNVIIIYIYYVSTTTSELLQSFIYIYKYIYIYSRAECNTYSCSGKNATVMYCSTCQVIFRPCLSLWALISFSMLYHCIGTRGVQPWTTPRYYTPAVQTSMMNDLWDSAQHKGKVTAAGDGEMRLMMFVRGRVREEESWVWTTGRAELRSLGGCWESPLSWKASICGGPSGAGLIWGKHKQ